MRSFRASCGPCFAHAWSRKVPLRFSSRRFSSPAHRSPLSALCLSSQSTPLASHPSSRPVSYKVRGLPTPTLPVSSGRGYGLSWLGLGQPPVAMGRPAPLGSLGPTADHQSLCCPLFPSPVQPLERHGAKQANGDCQQAAQGQPGLQHGKEVRSFNFLGGGVCRQGLPERPVLEEKRALTSLS